MKAIAARGTMYKDHDLAKKKAAAAAERAKTRTRTERTPEEWRNDVIAMRVRNDEGWDTLTQEQQLRQQDLEAIAKKSFWDNIKVADGFQAEIEVVLPGFWQPLFMGKSKKYLKPLVHIYLAKVVAIAEKKVENSLSAVDIANWDKWDILELFIEYKKSSVCARQRETSKKNVLATSKVMNVFGKVMGSATLYDEENDGDFNPDDEENSQSNLSTGSDGSDMSATEYDWEEFDE